MAKISEEELEKMQAEDRHSELIDSLKAIADRPGIENIVGEIGTLVKTIQSQKPIDMSPIAKELSSSIAELKQILDRKLTALVVERDKEGRIEKIIPEY
jgi:DNA-binding transcriptional regulator GbsR (MarR family)